METEGHAEVWKIEWQKIVVKWNGKNWIRNMYVRGMPSFCFQRRCGIEEKLKVVSLRIQTNKQTKNLPCQTRLLAPRHRNKRLLHGGSAQHRPGAGRRWPHVRQHGVGGVWGRRRAGRLLHRVRSHGWPLFQQPGQTEVPLHHITWSFLIKNICHQSPSGLSAASLCHESRPALRFAQQQVRLAALNDVQKAAHVSSVGKMHM